jgi:hypothetical protein
MDARHLFAAIHRVMQMHRFRFNVRNIWIACPACAIASSSLVALRPSLRDDGDLRVSSPDSRIVITVALRDGHRFYDVRRDGRALLLASRLGFTSGLSRTAA